MSRFRKLPVEIEAVQWLGGNISEVFDLIPVKPDGTFDLPPDGAYKLPGIGVCGSSLSIPTLEGVMTASIGDWIIRGVEGEIYPCKPDIFAATYETVA